MSLGECGSLVEESGTMKHEVLGSLGGLVRYADGPGHSHDVATERNHHAEVLCPVSTSSK